MPLFSPLFFPVQILENAEINNVIKIMGLQYKKTYDNADDLKTLRYGKLMIMTDQDQVTRVVPALINKVEEGGEALGIVVGFSEPCYPVMALKGRGIRSCRGCVIDDVIIDSRSFEHRSFQLPGLISSRRRRVL